MLPTALGPILDNHLAITSTLPSSLKESTESKNVVLVAFKVAQVKD
jgi:hypothetical protein